jgi:UDP-glucuronate decarboxylase
VEGRAAGLERGKSVKTILVTGGAGFIGSHLCDRLIERGDQVICVDNFFTGRKENITHLLRHPRFELIRHDIVHPLFIEVQQIYNLACPASPIHYQENAIKTIKTSTVGMVNMLGLAKRTSARILQASTSEVYGDPQVHPQPESYWGSVNPIGIRSCYDEGKRVAEALCMDYHRQNRVEIRIVRIFNTYGPRMHPQDGRVISNFIVQALRGEPITIYGDGSHTRSFCYVDDLLDGLIRMMDQDEATGPINLGNPEELSINRLAEEVLRETGSRSEVRHVALPSDDPRQRKPDIALARKVLGWAPRTRLEEGLRRTVEHFRERLRPEGLPEHAPGPARG